MLEMIPKELAHHPLDKGYQQQQPQYRKKADNHATAACDDKRTFRKFASSGIYISNIFAKRRAFVIHDRYLLYLIVICPFSPT